MDSLITAAARATLEEHGHRVNAAHARYLDVRRLLLIARIDEAERTLAEARRWMTPPVPGFTTTLLFPAPLPID